MGLDMYLKGSAFLFTDRDNPERNLMRDGYRVSDVTLDLGYWRKHPNLHGYIVNTFAKGVDQCQDIHLAADDIRDIIAAIKEKRLPHTQGPFFGESDGSEDVESIVIFENALTWLEAATPPAVFSEPAPGLTVVTVKTEANAAIREVREVVYFASW